MGAAFSSPLDEDEANVKANAFFDQPATPLRARSTLVPFVSPRSPQGSLVYTCSSLRIQSRFVRS